MKRLFLLGGFLFFSLFLFGQHVDSLATANKVDSLIQISRTLTGQGDFDKALEVNAVAEKLAMEKLGRETVAYGSCSFNHGRVLHFKREFSEAEKWYLEAISIQEKVLGKSTPDYANSLNNLAALYKTIGNYEKAEPLYLEAKDIRGKTLGKQHPDFVQILYNLAGLYMGMGNYEKAENFYLEAIEIFEVRLNNREHPYYKNCVHNLAILYVDMGNYEKAESLYLEAKDIREKTLGKQHPEYAASLSSLASLYSVMGNYEKAELLLLEAIAIREKTWVKDPPDYANSLNNLAGLYQDIGNYEKAEPLLLQAKTIREKALGKEHPDYAQSLNNLAALYRDMGNYEKAEPLLLEAIAIREKALGKEHPDYAKSLFSLGILYQNLDNYEKAEPLYLEAKAIREKALGREHPDYAKSLDNLAGLYQDIGNYEKAERLYAELASLNQSLITKSLHHLSERELYRYLLKFSESQAQMLSFSQLSARKKSVQTCFDNILFYKGFLLNAANQVKRLAFSDSSTTEKFNLLKSYERRLAAQYSQSIAARDSVKVAELETKANNLEKDLARTISGYRETMRQVKWQEVQQKLNEGEAAVEFVNFHLKQIDSTIYAALLLLPGTEQPKFIPLFEEKQLDSLLRGDGIIAKANNLYAVRGVKPVSGKTILSKNLYELIWKPMAKSLKGTHTVYFSPSGLLSQLNFSAIPTGKDKMLADRYRLIQLGSTRQLVIPADVKIKNNDAVLFGGIQYEMDSTVVKLVYTGLKMSETVASRDGLSFSQTDSTLRGGTWNYLPGTEKEIVAVEEIMQISGIEVQPRKGWLATEEAFKHIENPSPRILHLATHGFFFTDPKTTVDGRRWTVDGSEPVFKISDNPLIRSGLILAGGNYAWQTGKPLKPNMEDGILTAYEISQMNLSNTELVVLSACETGLGDIQGNEGVYGLQRAFKIAGAKYLIMSLWQVPDKQTSLLMTTFYKKWLEEKMAIPEAFRAAQKELREAGLDPYQWAGFVLVE